MTTALSTRHDSRTLLQPDASLPAPAEFAQMQAMAEVIHASGMFPAHKSWQAILTCMIKGRELGIPATEAMQQIYMIQGKATCSANLMLSLVQRDHGSRAMYVDLTRSDATKATIVYRDPRTNEPVDYVYTMAMAKIAKLDEKPMWKTYPQHMLIWRGVSTVARAVYPASIAGLHTPEELGASVRFDDEGYAVIDVPGEGLGEPRPAGEGAPEHAWPATARQIGYLKGLADDAQWSRPVLVAYASKQFGVERLEELSRDEASTLIEHLRGLLAAAPLTNDEPSVDEQLARDIDSVIQHARNALTMQHVRQAYKRAELLGLLDDPEVAAAIEAARQALEQPPSEQGQQQLPQG